MDKDLKKILVDILSFMEKDIVIIEKKNRPEGYSLRKLKKIKDRMKRMEET